MNELDGDTVSGWSDTINFLLIFVRSMHLLSIFKFIKCMDRQACFLQF